MHPEKQDRLRSELSTFVADPTYDQLTNDLPYLEAIAREILRLHPPVEEIIRVVSNILFRLIYYDLLTVSQAVEDDIIPLNDPIMTATSKEVKSINVARGVGVRVPIGTINKSEEVWGPDAKQFVPERWLSEEQGLTPKAKEIQGYHHLMTFVDGPRICLGRAFAVMEFKVSLILEQVIRFVPLYTNSKLKAVLSVLIRNYAFKMRDGPETKLDMTSTLLPRPKVAGEEGYALPMRVRRLEE